MIPTDAEDKERISRHRQEREGWGFETIEAGRDILAATQACDEHGTFLLDSVTALLANEMFTPDGRVELDAYKKVTDDLTKLLDRVRDIIIVSDFIYSDAFLYDELTEAYRRSLAYIDRRVAALCDVVLEVSSGNYIIHKGEW
jgi:adenosylcobinamide kinase/adenosylcobinamide-phosphate guanylyltransferase